MTTDLLKHDCEAKTDLYCHSCSQTFVALLDYSIDGNHKILCPYCQHIHYRVIKEGRVTSERYDSDLGNEKRDYVALRTWKASSLAISTTTGSEFIRQRWYDKVTGRG